MHSREHICESMPSAAAIERGCGRSILKVKIADCFDLYSRAHLAVEVRHCPWCGRLLDGGPEKIGGTDD